MMKIYSVVFAMLIAALGCGSQKIHQDNFASLQCLVKQTLAGNDDCGPVITNQMEGYRCFEIQPLPDGLLVTVSERHFYTQADWKKRYDAGTNLMSEFMEMAKTNRSMDLKTAQHFDRLGNAFLACLICQRGIIETVVWMSVFRMSMLSTPGSIKG